MTRCLCLGIVVFAIGCGQQYVVIKELTPLEEYALATQVADRETNILYEMKRTHDPSNPDDKKRLDAQQAIADVANSMRHKAQEKIKNVKN